MPTNVTQKLVTALLSDGCLRTGAPITLKIDQTLMQDATGTLVMLTLEALELERVRTEVGAQYNGRPRGLPFHRRKHPGHGRKHPGWSTPRRGISVARVCASSTIVGEHFRGDDLGEGHRII